MRKILPLALAALVLGCSDEPTGGEATSTSTASETTTVTSGGPPPSRPLVPPDEVKNVLAAVPANATIVVSLPALASLGVPKEALDGVLPLALPEVSKESGLSEATLKSLVEGFDGGAGFAVGDVREDGGNITIALRFKDGKVVEDAINELKLEKKTAGLYTFKKGDTTAHIQWLPKPRMLLVSKNEAGITEALDALSGKSPSFADGPNAKAAVANRFFAFGDLHALVKDESAFAAGSLVSLAFGTDDSEMTYRQLGEKVPRIGQVLAPTSHDLLGKLPGKPILAIDLSLARAAGKTLKDFFAEIGRASGSDPTPTAEKGLAAVGITLADLDRALGDGIAFGVYIPDGPVVDPSKLEDKATFLMALSVKDDAVVKTIFEAVKKTSRDKKLKFGANDVTIDDGKKGGRVELVPGFVIGSFGDKPAADKAIAAFKASTTPLGGDAAFVESKKKAAPSQLAILFDYDQLAKSIPKDLPFKMPFELKGYGWSDLALAASDQGVDAKISGAAAVPLLGMGAGVAIYGVRRYLQSAKSSEAKNALGAIARAAVGAYERESLASGHALCKSAPPVPATVPSGVKYQPETSPGKDFETGDDTTGWKCLKFTITTPTYYKYEYRAGSGYKCPARGGKDPGPDGFEASAEGDLDADGKTSLFCMTGKVDKATQMVRVDTELFVVDEFE